MNIFRFFILALLLPFAAFFAAQGSEPAAAAAAAAPDGPSAPTWGYAGAQSVVQGGDIGLHISSQASTLTLIVYRYGATGLVEKTRVNGFVPTWRDCTESHFGCGWPLSYTLHISPDWQSGLYTVRLLTPGEDPKSLYGEWIHFIVREDRPGSTSPVLFMLSDATWQAYNYRAGLSYYPDDSIGRGWTQRLSFDRPYDRCDYLWTCPPLRNLPMIKWLESNGYTPEYASNYDLHTMPDLLPRYRFFMDDAHDEYWSWEMRDRVDAFLALGRNMASFSANTAYWQIRFENGGRDMVSYKSRYTSDPVYTDGDPSNDYLTTYYFCAPPVNRCTTLMTGITYFNGGNAKASTACPYCTGGFTAYYPEHWLWQGTGIRKGQLFGTSESYGSTVGLASAEVDSPKLTMTSAGNPVITQAAIAQGTPATFQILAVTNAVPVFQGPAYGTMGIYTTAAGSTVFVTGSWDWAVVGLSSGNAIVDRVTRNMFNRLAFNAPWPENGTVAAPMGADWNMISVPLNADSASVADVFATMSGKYDLINAYDACRPEDPWQSYDPSAPAFVNTLTKIDPARGLWVHATTQADWSYSGGLLRDPVTLHLCAGWNLVGYPSLSARPVADVLAPIAGRYDLVQTYRGTDPADPWRSYDPSAPPFVNSLTQLSPGEGYWIHMTQPADLTIQP
jgi:hypothetical protein